jgi:hypothetical protein
VVESFYVVDLSGTKGVSMHEGFFSWLFTLALDRELQLGLVVNLME